MAKIHENFGASRTWQWTFLRQYNDGLELLKLPRLNWHKNTVENKTASSAHSWEKDGPVIGALDSESRILCSRPGQVKVLCPPTKKFNLGVPLSNQQYKWVLENCQRNLMKCRRKVGGGGITLWWTSIQGGAMVSPVASCYRYQDKFWLAGSFCLSRDFAFTFSTVRIKSLIKKTW